MTFSYSEQITYSTVRIECKYHDGNIGTGTGFFFTFSKGGENITVVITNKHVINGSKSGSIILTKANINNEPTDNDHLKIDFESFESFWRIPSSGVDLCAMSLEPILIAAKSLGEKLFFYTINESHIPTQQQLDDFSALEEILMAGYPNGLWDFVNNKPILRRGITASHPKMDYCGKKEILIDAACFPGSSGSPVFIFNNGDGYTDKHGNVYLGRNRVILLGVLYAAPLQNIQGDIEIINVQTSLKPIVLSRIPINLGVIIKAEKVLELKDLF